METTIETANGWNRNASIHTARFALSSSLWARAEQPRVPDDDALVDLLADLRHLCADLGIDYDACDSKAAMHFDTEQRVSVAGGAS